LKLGRCGNVKVCILSVL